MKAIFILLAAVISTTPVLGKDYPSVTLNKTVPAGKKFKMDWHHSLNPDCTIRGFPEVRLLGGPSHGSVSSSRGKDYPSFSQSNPMAKCNLEARQSTQVWYTPASGYIGADAFDVLAIYPSGKTRKVYYRISVK